MKSFINVEDIGDLQNALAEAQEIKNDRYKYQHLGRNKTLMIIFFNNSLRTRDEFGHERHRARCECRCMEIRD